MEIRRWMTYHRLTAWGWIDEEEPSICDNHGRLAILFRHLNDCW